MVLAELGGLPLEIILGRDYSSITAVLRGTATGTDEAEPNTVLLRADMDALPVSAEDDDDFASLAPGRMPACLPACEYDLHNAMLIDTARLLSAYRDQITRDVVFIFQPGDEGYDGAALMIREGVPRSSSVKRPPVGYREKSRTHKVRSLAGPLLRWFRCRSSGHGLGYNGL